MVVCHYDRMSPGGQSTGKDQLCIYEAICIAANEQFEIAYLLQLAVKTEKIKAFLGHVLYRFQVTEDFNSILQGAL
jgi:hypothetical protein